MGLMKPREKANIPAGLEYLYNMFNEIRFSLIPMKGVNMLSPREPLTFSELKSYMEISEMKLSYIECDAIMRMDSIFNNAS